MNKKGLLRENFQIINWLRQKSIFCVLTVLLFIYCLINCIFGIVYFHLSIYDQFTTSNSIVEQGISNTQGYIIQANTEKATSSAQENSILHYIYFSFITAATIGYGDFYPTVAFGKVLVMIQSVFCSVYVAVMMSIITSKLMWATTHTIFFSKQIVYNRQQNIFEVRVINTNSLPVINPEVKITLTQHQIGDCIANMRMLDNSFATPSYLGRHDFVIKFGMSCIDLSELQEADIIQKELNDALHYERKASENRSRFKITITISGSNGIQNIAEIKKYHAKDFVEGTGFVPICYGGKDKDWLGMKYKRIHSFWEQFEEIKDKKDYK